MNTAELFGGDEAKRILDRASRAAGTGLSAFRYLDGTETERVDGCGTCAAACAHVAQLPWGSQACRRSREKAAAIAAKRGRPVAHLCHMGFALVTSPMVADDPEILLTFGPYCPAETPDALERDAAEGLARLDPDPKDSLPFTLEDIPRVPAGTPPAVAEWAAETLTKHFTSERNGALEATETGDPPPVRRARRASKRTVRDPYEAHALLAALVAGDARRARSIANKQLALPVGSARIRALAIAAAVLDAGDLGDPTSIATLADRLDNATSPQAIRTEMLKTLRGTVGKSNDADPFFSMLDSAIRADLSDPPELAELAYRLDTPPSTVTRRLQRRYGLSYSEYLARIRIDRAKELLSSSRLSVDTIARRVGLTDGSHLRKLMHKFEGRAPSSYRSKSPR